MSAYCRHLVKELKGSLCSYLHTQDMGTFTLYELAIRCKSNAMITPSDVCLLTGQW